MLRRSWAEIDISVLRNNYDILKKNISDTLEPMAVIKANAYGHGDGETARILQDAGCRNFAVSNILEAIGLRDAGIEGQILILGYTPAAEAENLKKYRITQAILSEQSAEAFKGTGILAQFAIDTGMNRIGLDADDPDHCEEVIRRYADAFELTGLFTHLCTADTEQEDEFTRTQLEKFKAVCSRVEDLKLPFNHCMNSAGSLYHEAYGAFARLGIVLYGLKPDRKNVLPEGIKPALTWKSVISMIKTVDPGETIGYGRTFTADRKMRIATIPTGYADGYSRALSNKGGVYICGKRAPIIGRICMDQLMADVTDIPEAEEEDEVLLLSDYYDADDMAADLGTIGYEIICGISPRVERIYVNESSDKA